jgi:regulator of PEP synthase PpsR (kinase-PPPase family)
MELFDTFVGPLSEELGVPPTRKSGQSHSLKNPNHYDIRIEAINFAMANDDGMRVDNFGRADVILVGVSRSGKTPTCLYLAMHFGLKAANYPLTEEDFEKGRPPDALVPHRSKLFGLTIDPVRLQRIRQERRPNSSYASLQRCQDELRQAHAMFDQLGINVLNTTSHSIEEISSHIVKTL